MYVPADSRLVESLAEMLRLCLIGLSVAVIIDLIRTAVEGRHLAWVDWEA
jgi:hypothetical protein